jgi:hypothetical protein
MAPPRPRPKLIEIQDALGGITRRAANIRAGHVYVISNIGAFSDDIVKIGMTRMTRMLEPMDRIRELGDASVPFRVWRDTDDLWPGEDWRAKIRDAITHNALVFIACFSKQSVARMTSYQN